MALGDIIQIEDRTLLVLGQELRLESGQPDVANALVHRAGGTLVLVDTGASSAFREPLTRAARRLLPWTSILLLTSHRHIDHIGNNDVIDEMAEEAGVTRVQHFVSAHDAA